MSKEFRNANQIPDDHTIKGETWKQWATRMFEFENCGECGQDDNGHLPAIVMGNWFALCKSKPVTDVIFRVWRKKDHDPIAIFPAVPEDARGRYCQMYEHVGQHSGGDYLNVVRQTRLAKPAEYAALKKELESEPYNYVLRVCQRQTKQHRREFDLTLKAWLTRNQDSSVRSTLAEGSDTKPPKLPKAGDLFRYEEQDKVIAEITSMYHIPSIRFEAKGQNQYVAIRALEWDGGMEWWYKKPLKDETPSKDADDNGADDPHAG